MQKTLFLFLTVQVTDEESEQIVGNAAKEILNLDIPDSSSSQVCL